MRSDCISSWSLLIFLLFKLSIKIRYIFINPLIYFTTIAKGDSFKFIKKYMWASSWENLSSGFATRVDSNRPVHPQRLEILDLETKGIILSRQRKQRRRLICAFVVRIWHKQVLSWGASIVISSFLSGHFSDLVKNRLCSCTALEN